MTMIDNMLNAGNASGTGANSPVLSIIGTLLSAYGQGQTGASRYASAQSQAAQLSQNAGQTLAGAQHDAQDIQRKTDYLTSRALAIAASSGGGASDPTVLNLIAQVSGEGAYRKALALYQGDESARRMNMQAGLTERVAGEESRANNIAVTSTILKGGASLYDKYGGGGPGKQELSSNSGPSNSYIGDLP